MEAQAQAEAEAEAEAKRRRSEKRECCARRRMGWPLYETRLVAAEQVCVFVVDTRLVLLCVWVCAVLVAAWQ